jgi:hypothetical protein
LLFYLFLHPSDHTERCQTQDSHPVCCKLLQVTPTEICQQRRQNLFAGAGPLTPQRLLTSNRSADGIPENLVTLRVDPHQVGTAAVLHSGFEILVLDLTKATRTVIASVAGGRRGDGASENNCLWVGRGGRRTGRGSVSSTFSTTTGVDAVRHRVADRDYRHGWHRGAKTVFSSTFTNLKAMPTLTLFDWR